MSLDLSTLKQAISGHAAAFRCVTEYQPAGGKGDKVFPPTYEGGKYAVEKRVAADGEGLVLYAKHTADARAHLGRQPNIDRLLVIQADGRAWSARLVPQSHALTGIERPLSTSPGEKKKIPDRLIW